MLLIVIANMQNASDKKKMGIVSLAPDYFTAIVLDVCSWWRMWVAMDIRNITFKSDVE